MGWQDGDAPLNPFRAAETVVRQAVASIPVENQAARLEALIPKTGFQNLPDAVRMGLIEASTIAHLGDEIAAAQDSAADARHRQTNIGLANVVGIAAAGLSGITVGASTAAPAAPAAPAAAAGEGAIIAAESGAIAAGADLALMPAAVVDQAAIAAMGSGGLGETLTNWAIAAGKKIATSAASSLVLGALRGPQPTPTITINAPQQALTTGRGTMPFENIFEDFNFGAIGDAALQIAVNRLMPANTSGAAPLQAGPVLAALPSLPALGGMALGMAGAGGGAARAAAGILRSAGGRILGWMLPSGQKVSRAAAVNLAKNLGLTAAATAIGASATDLAEAVMQEEGRKRRRRGISATDLTRTTRTMARVERMHRRIAKAARAHTR